MGYVTCIILLRLEPLTKMLADRWPVKDNYMDLSSEQHSFTNKCLLQKIAFNLVASLGE